MKILIADDDPVSRRMLESLLKRWGYEVSVTNDGDEAWSALQLDDSAQLAVLDWMMPHMDGIEVCKKIREKNEERYKYVILLTAKNQKKDIVEGLSAGADDYLTKPFDPHELKVRLRAGRRIIELLNELNAARESLLVKATHDPLTGLWNREEIINTLEREISRARRDSIPVCVIMADIDHFKRINDAFGHMTGDSVLKEVAKRLFSSLRHYDSLARYGGEEFLVVLPECNGSNGVQVAERMRINICSTPIDTPEGLIPITISMGVAASSDVNVLDSDALVKVADIALYRAKNSGRNRVELAIPADVKQEQQTVDVAPPLS